MSRSSGEALPDSNWGEVAVSEDGPFAVWPSSMTRVRWEVSLRGAVTTPLAWPIAAIPTGVAETAKSR